MPLSQALTHHCEHLPEEHGMGAGTFKKQFWREGASGCRPTVCKVVCTGVEQRGKENVLKIEKHLRISELGCVFNEDCVSSCTAKMLAAV